MNWKKEWKALLLLSGVFLACFYMPIQNHRFSNAILQSLRLVRWYAREHVLLCLVPAFFIAGAIAVFINRGSVTQYLGARANKILAYGLASVSGTTLAACSCTVLPLFAGIYRMGAGLGPATAFLYSGPAINVLAIILTARVLGIRMGIARGAGAIVLSVVIGLSMQFIFRREELERAEANVAAEDAHAMRPLWQNALFFASMVAVLVFANWGKPQQPSGLWYVIYSAKWTMAAVSAALFAVMLVAWSAIQWWQVMLTVLPCIFLGLVFPGRPVVAFMAGVVGLSVITSQRQDEAGEWFNQTWKFAKQILPLLFVGVAVAGFCLGHGGQEGIVPAAWVNKALGGNSLFANFSAALAGALMYFATLTEVPILEGLIRSGMGKGPALALLLAGPALSLPNMLVIRSVIGTKKTLVFVTLVVAAATITGIMYGAISRGVWR